MAFSKHLYSLAEKKHLVSLDNIDGDLLCEVKPEEVGQDWSSRWKHRQECHQLCFIKCNNRKKAAGLQPLELKKCRTSAQSHCECFMRKLKLHSRLRAWVPAGLNYCRQCNMFTRRKKWHNGRCKNNSLSQF
jgi:hypothetical protein